jgi:hypothetical protein
MIKVLFVDDDLVLNEVTWDNGDTTVVEVACPVFDNLTDAMAEIQTILAEREASKFN